MPRRSVPALARSAGWCLIFAVVGLFGAARAQAADAVKVAGFWIHNVHVQTISDGQIVYITANGARVQQGLAQLEGLRLEHDPNLGKAGDAIAQHQDADAAKLLEQVADKATRKWVRHYARWLRIGALTRAKQPVEAVEDYLALVKADAGDAYLANPPTDAIKQLTAQQRQQVIGSVQAMSGSVSDGAQPYLQKLLSAISGTKPAAPAAAPAKNDQAAVQPGGSGAAAPADTATQTPANTNAGSPAASGGTSEGASAVVLPKQIRQDHITPLLRAGQFQQALDAVNAELKQSGDLSVRLYEKGMAELGLAEKSNSRDGYLDAGLDFMRVVVYFPHSMYAGPSLVEAGYVHVKIDRPEIARQLYQEASGKVDAYTDPSYAQRLQKLTAALKK